MYVVHIATSTLFTSYHTIFQVVGGGGGGLGGNHTKLHENFILFYDCIAKHTHAQKIEKQFHLRVYCLVLFHV